MKHFTAHGEGPGRGGAAGRWPGHPVALAAAAAVAVLGAPLLPGAGGAQAQPLPTVPSVVQGRAAISTQGRSMTVTNSPDAVIQWQSFSVGAGHSVRFDQAGPGSQVLNRVVGADPSTILGAISSNGKVWLLNPHGVLFGKAARIDVAGLVASTLNLSDADWQARRLVLRASDTPLAERAAVVNQGEIRTAGGGRVLLIAGPGGVRNEGLIEARDGQILLAAGQRVDLLDTGLPNLAIRVEAPSGAALNLGTMLAGAGFVDLQAAIVNQSGIVRADALERAGGQIVLRASESLGTAAGSLTSAQGTAGGRIVADSGLGTATHAGTLVAPGPQGTGGHIALLGRRIGLVEGATVDASGAAGGGEILVGGGLRGQDARVANAEAVFIGPQAVLRADATGRGDGGRLIVWSDRATRAYGSFSARGGPEGGAGGLVETSGGWLDARPRSVNTQAPKGRAGTWLIDPHDLTITSDPSAQDERVERVVEGSTEFSTTGDAAVLSTRTIESALREGNVYILTSDSEGSQQSGNIVFSNATLRASPEAAATLRLVATGRISSTGNSAILAPGAPLTVEFDAGEISLGNFTIDTGGRIVLSAGAVQLLPGLSLSAGAAGTAIEMRGRDAGPGCEFNCGIVGIGSFSNTSAAGSLVTPRGGWLIHAAHPRDGFVAGALDHSATYYGGRTGLYSQVNPNGGGTGRDLLFDVAPVLSLDREHAVPVTKTYDGTTQVTVSHEGGPVRGAIAGDRLFGVFAGKDAGRDILVLIDDAALTAVDSVGKPVYGYQAEWGSYRTSGNIAPRPVQLAITVAGKDYDGRTTAAVATSSLSGLVGAESLSVAAAAQFTDKNAGPAKAVTGSASLADGANGGRAANYQLAQTDFAPAEIRPRGLTLASATAADKPYDGTTAATITGWTLREIVAGDSVAVASGSAAFADPAVGAGKTVRATAGSLGGSDAGNYALAQPTVTTRASIAAPPVVSPPIPVEPPDRRAAGLLPPPLRTTPSEGRTLDAGLAFTPGTGTTGRVFASLDVAGMTQDQLRSALAVRASYKQSLFAAASERLAADPSLADAPACVTLEQIDTGACLVTAELGAQAREAAARQTGVVRAQAGVAPKAATPAAPRARPGAGASPGAPPATSPGPAAAAAPRTAPPPAAGVLPALAVSRPVVRQAALPQIQRKLAIVIGIDNHADARIPRLDNARADAQAVADVLGSQLGYETAVIQDGSKAAILRRLNRVVAQAGPQDSVVIYYAGHGMVVASTGLGYWIPANADAMQPETWISNSDIAKVLARIPASQVALISDSCFSGSLVSDERIDAASAPPDAQALLGRRAAVVMSSGGNEPVADSGKNGHSTFSWNLMRSLEKVSSWRPGANVFEQVRFAVSRELPQRPRYGAARLGGHERGADYVFEQRRFEGYGP